MTLSEFFQYLSDRPVLLLTYFILIPITALLAGVIGKNEGHLTPWKQLYAVLIYLVCVPGIFSVALDLYLFLFERRSVMEANVYTQILPIVSMVATLLIIRKNVDFRHIPGFKKLSGLIFMLAAVIALFWILDRTRIYVISFLRWEVALLMFAGLFGLIYFGWSRMVKS